MCLAVSAISTAQEPVPTYEETAAWIQSKFPSLNGTYKGGGLSMTLDYTFTSMTDCTLTYNGHISDTYNDGSTDGGATDHRIDLSKVSLLFASNIDGVPGIRLISTSQAFARFVGRPAWNSQNESFIYTANPSVDNADLGPRLVKALNHAASLCKAQAPKSNEPF